MSRPSPDGEHIGAIGGHRRPRAPGHANRLPERLWRRWRA